MTTAWHRSSVKLISEATSRTGMIVSPGQIRRQ
jgi:hypothetical protein